MGKGVLLAGRLPAFLGRLPVLFGCWPPLAGRLAVGLGCMERFLLPLFYMAGKSMHVFGLMGYTFRGLLY